MKTLNSPAGKRLSKQALELSIAAPQVVAQRVARMAMAGPNPSARDQKEFKQMSDEKVAAFYQSWSAIWSQMFKSQFVIAHAMNSAVVSAMLSGRSPSMGTAFQAVASETSKVMSAGMKPVHRKAVPNAKRLSRR